MGSLRLHFYTSILIILLTKSLSITSLQCKGENNEDVDWYVLYKLPKISDSKNGLIREGVAYLYMDSANFPSGWQLSKKDISKKNSIPGYTTAPFYDNKDSRDLLWILYNDQPPNEPARFNNGHTKGAVIANENEGFWLVHSVPNFPPKPSSGRDANGGNDKDFALKHENYSNDSSTIEYSYPNSGKVNGQSFLCISARGDTLNTIGTQLMYNQIIVYRRNTPSNLSHKYNILVDAANQVRVKQPPYTNKLNFESAKRTEFTSFAKTSKWQKDLYDDFVAPELNTDLFTETWLNGRGKLPSECTKSRVMNIQSIHITEANAQFKSSHDHSKWAVATDGKQKASWVCIGDINRADTQFERGGGTVCLNLPEVWKNYRDSVKDVEPCPVKSKPKRIYEKIKSWIGL